jgi:hypothetical protein
MRLQDRRKAVLSVKEILEPLQKGEGLLGQVIQNPEFGKEGMSKIQATLDNIQEITQHIREGRGVVGRLLKDDTLAARLDDLGKAVKDLSTLLESMSNGEGAIGSLTKKGGDAEIAIADFKVTRTVCPNHAGGNNHWHATYSRNTKLIYIPGVEGCDDITNDHSRHVKGKFDGGGYVSSQRLTASVVAVDPTTGQVKIRKELPYPIFGGTLSTAGGIVMTGMVDGTLVAMDEQTLDELWSVNVGTGFDAPPMTYAVDGKQYIAIASGLFRNARNSLSKSPETRNLSNATMIFVFGL